MCVQIATEKVVMFHTFAEKHKKHKNMGLFSAIFGATGHRDAEKYWNRYYATAETEYRNMANQGINNTAYQQALAAEKNMLKDNLDTIRATSAVTGATPAAEAIAREQNMQAIADSTAKMGANITQDRNTAMQGYLQAARDAASGKAAAATGQAQAETQAGAGLIGGIGSLIGSIIS